LYQMRVRIDLRVNFSRDELNAMLAKDFDRQVVREFNRRFRQASRQARTPITPPFEFLCEFRGTGKRHSGVSLTLLVRWEGGDVLWLSRPARPAQ